MDSVEVLIIVVQSEHQQVLVIIQLHMYTHGVVSEVVDEQQRLVVKMRI